MALQALLYYAILTIFPLSLISIYDVPTNTL